MRPGLVALFAALPVALSACASTGDQNRFHNELERLAQDCEARGGILSPSGRQTGRPQVDNVCNITAQPSRRTGG